MPDFDSIKVAVLYGEALLAEGLKFTIDQAGLEVVGIEDAAHVVVADYETALSLLSMPEAFATARRSSLPRVLILSSRPSCSEVRHAMAAGALGYLTSDCSLEESIAAIRTVHKGIRYLSMTAAAKLAEDMGCQLLTARELDVLRLLAEGHGNKAIARELDIALGTVKSHVKAILHKLDATTRTGAATVADRRGLLDLSAAHARARPSPPRHRARYARVDRAALSM